MSLGEEQVGASNEFQSCEKAVAEAPSSGQCDGQGTPGLALNCQCTEPVLFQS